MMEEIASGFNLDVFFHEIFLGDIRKNNILRILIKHSESIWNSRIIFILFIFKILLQLFNVFALLEFWMLSDFSQ